MSGIQLALKFITESRNNNEIKQQIKNLKNKASLADLVEIAKNLGLTFTVNELRIAFKYDWQMRWHRYNSDK